MTRQDFAIITLRLLGLLCFVLAILELEPTGQYIGLALAPGGGASTILRLGMVWSVISLIILLAAGVVLLTQSPKLARFLVGSQSGSVGAVGPSATDIQSVAFATVGVLLVGLALPRLAEAGMMLHLFQTQRGVRTLGEVVSARGPQLISVLLQLLLGLLLLVGARSLTRLISWIRRLGVK
jgi:hypothetical protein